ncbi:uncharacterized protein B0H18DRAFT_1124920 [Fomitopsis serialis]|uniref:uncharacterized protein n=1 Tax=Fomitopsis serialis TaxID=139415 RepID=UPI002008D879|nr:uncharacterized protein B0H18DRAFT_1124920 [Neoantrodia serialis]KAH9915406.1 hypothetical protein B0H18DRAFT_1124920 [Neoantrodia serialis]
MFNTSHTVYISDRTTFDLLVKQLRVSLCVKHRLTTMHTVVVQRKSFPFTKPGQDRPPFMDSLPLVLAGSLPALRVLEIQQALRPVMHPMFYLALRHHEQTMSLRSVDVQLHGAQLQRIIRALAWKSLSYRPPAGSSGFVSYATWALGIKPLALQSMVTWLAFPALCASLRNLSVEFRNLAHGDCGSTTGLIDRMLEGSGPSPTSFSQIHDKFPVRNVPLLRTNDC